jgi:predicted phosphodiesterase
MKEGLFYTPEENSFKDRKEIMDLTRPCYLYDRATEALKRAQEVCKEASIGVSEAVWTPETTYPDKPLAVLLATDIHYGSIHTDYDLLDKHLNIVENTPNFSMISNGDNVDNFNVTGKWATGVYENPLSPQFQTKAFLDRLKRIDAQGRLGVMSFGNHDNFMANSGYDWLETFAQGMKASIFTSGGLLHILYGKQHYEIALTHKYWGVSKLNPTNSVKRFLDFEYSQADVVFLGHTHQSELITFERGGHEVIGCIGGTYKLDDTYARQNGIGGRAGHPGITVYFTLQNIGL